MSRDFRWDEWNREHATRHGVSIAEIEGLIRRGRARFVGDGKYEVVGRGIGGWWIRTIYIISPAECIYPIHARPLNEAEKRRQRRSK